MYEYDFTNNWFQQAKPVWQSIFRSMAPKKILEIGSYEGASACFMIDTLNGFGGLEVHCVDTWQGGVEHENLDMESVKVRFHRNTGLALSNATCHVDLCVREGSSDDELVRMLAEGKQEYFDFIYIDGSHRASDVLCDAVLSFKLLKVGGVMVFDDYLWSFKVNNSRDVTMEPKIAIDAFTTIYSKKCEILRAPLYQIYVRKIDQ